MNVFGDLSHSPNTECLDFGDNQDYDTEARVGSGPL